MMIMVDQAIVEAKDTLTGNYLALAGDRAETRLCLAQLLELQHKMQPKMYTMKISDKE